MRLAIIGAGFTGTQLAVELLRRLPAGSSILLFERSGVFGPGLAYSTAHADHLLNVRAANMSAFEDDPSHFLRWLWAGDLPGPLVPPSGHAFMPRGLYGRYLAETLAAAETQAAPEVTVERIARSVNGVDETDEGVDLRFSDGGRCRVDLAVLATGNNPPQWPYPEGLAAIDPRRLIGDPWDDGELGRIGPDDDVVILGTGLTAVDVVTLLGRRGHRGRITALSRRGLLPSVHEQTRPWKPFLVPGEDPRPLAYLRRVRAEVRKAAAEGIGWRSVVDALRPATQDLWRALPLAERRRFLRHLRPWWEVHRHRMAPQVAEGIFALRDAGQFAVKAARIRGWAAAPEGLAITLGPKGGGPAERLTAAFAVNCTGVSVDYRRISAPLVRHLLDRGLARPDSLGLGFDVDETFGLIAADGTASRRIFALGPPCKSGLWEITAVPDIRKQSRAFALRLFPDRDRGTPS